jgi:predicted dehydrogenase
MPFKTALVGFGKIAQGYARDPVMAKLMQYSSHGQVLRDHPAFDFCAVVDSALPALKQAQSDYPEIAIASSCAELTNGDDIQVLVLSTPPDNRLSDIKGFNNLQAVIVEKPLGIDLKSSQEFLSYCQERNIKVQVNLLRRADSLTSELAAGTLTEHIGKLQAGFGLYGNGIKNNGVHMVDLVRLLLGPIERVIALPGLAFTEGPITADINLPFALTLATGQSIFFSPVKFSAFRENGLQLIGDSGKLDYLHGGLSIYKTPLGPNRMVSGEMELVYDKPESIASTLGQAFYRMYDNLADNIHNGTPLCSSAQSALASTAIVEAILRSKDSGYSAQTIEP